MEETEKQIEENTSDWKKSVLGLIAAAVLAVTIASQLMPRLLESERQPKSGESAIPHAALRPLLDFDAAGTHIRLNGQPPAYLSFALVAIGQKPVLLWKGLGQEWKGALDVAAKNVQRYCLFTAEEPAELERQWAAILKRKRIPEDVRCVGLS